MWRLFRAWSVARVTGEIPVVVWKGVAVGKVVALCPLCGECCVGLRHLVCICSACEDLRRGEGSLCRGQLFTGALGGTNDLEQLRAKVKLVGLCAARFAHAIVVGTMIGSVAGRR